MQRNTIGQNSKMFLATDQKMFRSPIILKTKKNVKMKTKQNKNYSDKELQRCRVLLRH